MMTEADICDAALLRLRAEGWLVACEVQTADMVAMRADDLMTVEAKKTLNKVLKHQLQTAMHESDFVLAVVGKMPGSDGIAWLLERGIGLWVIAEEVHAPKRLLPLAWAKQTVLAYAKAIAAAFPNRRAGLPTGHERPAQDIAARVAAYRAENPTATWKEIHAAVPSHYLTPKNMYSALRSNAERLAFRDRMKAMKKEAAP